MIKAKPLSWLTARARSIRSIAWHRAAKQLDELEPAAQPALLRLLPPDTARAYGILPWEVTGPRGRSRFLSYMSARDRAPGPPDYYGEFTRLAGVEGEPALQAMALTLVAVEQRLFLLACVEPMLELLGPRLEEIHHLHLLWPELLPVLCHGTNAQYLQTSVRPVLNYGQPHHKRRKDWPYRAVPLAPGFRALMGEVSGALLTELMLTDPDKPPPSGRLRALELPHDTVATTVEQAWLGPDEDAA